MMTSPIQQVRRLLVWRISSVCAMVTPKVTIEVAFATSDGSPGLTAELHFADATALGESRISELATRITREVRLVLTAVLR